MNKKTLRLRNAVRRGAADTFYTDGNSGNPWPVYLWLDRSDGSAWIDQYEPGMLPVAVRDGRMAVWELNCVPTRKEAYALVRELSPLLRLELRRPGTSEDEIAHRCLEFTSDALFATGSGMLELSETWFDANGEEDWPGNGVRVEIRGCGSITPRTSDRRLRAIGAAIRAANAGTLIVDLLPHLQSIRQSLSDV